MFRSRHSKRHEHTSENDPTKRKKKGVHYVIYFYILKKEETASLLKSLPKMNFKKEKREKMTYIKNVKTLEELKKTYKKLSLKLHPDCGGSDKEMAKLNNEYDELFSKLKNYHKNKEGEIYKKETSETPEEFKEIIDKLFALKMIDIEIEIMILLRSLKIKRALSELRIS